MGNERHGKLAYTVQEAAGLLSLSRAHLYRVIDLGEIGTVRIGRCRRITAGQLDEFLRRREAETGLPADPAALPRQVRR